MIKYNSAAICLRGFSCCSFTKALYRNIGNTYFSKGKIQSTIPKHYIERIIRMIKLNKKYNIIKDGDRIIELGTGWVHWEALSLRLFFDIKGILFDVWDNRQMNVLKHYFNIFKNTINNDINIDKSMRTRSLETINVILNAGNYDEIYDKLGFKYVINESGKLDIFNENYFNIIISAGTLEHVKTNILNDYIRDFYRILKPGGFSIHSINLSDHLSFYDNKSSLKNYLRYSDWFWKLVYQNEVQYFNRVQKTEWLDYFKNNKLDLIEEESINTNLNLLKINKKYYHLSKDDLACINLKILHIKPTTNNLV